MGVKKKRDRSAKSLVDKDAKRRAVLRRVSRGTSIRDAARLSGCAYETARRWVREAERIGFDIALKPRRKARSWPLELKKEVVEAYLLGESPSSLMVRYGLPHANYPGLWARKMNTQKPDSDSRTTDEQKAKGAAKRAVAAHQSGSQSWRKWVEVMRSHFDAAVEASDSDSERVRLLQLQADILEKCFALSSSTKPQPSALTKIAGELKANFPLTQVLPALGLARSTYYWHRQQAGRPDPDAPLCKRLKAAHKMNRSVYGYRRLQACLGTGADGLEPVTINHKKMKRLMRKIGIQGKRPTKKRYNSFKGGDPNSVNVLNRSFQRQKPREALVTDITMFTLKTSRVYLSPLIDIYNNEIISYQLSTSPSNAMTCAMLQDGLETLPPGQSPVVHSDQGSQYTCHRWRNILTKHGATRSMSRVGNCHDNAPAEAFFARLKTELGNDHLQQTLNQFSEDLEDYIHWWNHERIVTRLKTSPVKYRQENTTPVQ